MPLLCNCRCSCVAPVIRSFSTTTGGPPKRPLTGYMTYVKEMQPSFSRQNPGNVHSSRSGSLPCISDFFFFKIKNNLFCLGLKNVDIVRKLAEKWRMLTPEQKQVHSCFHIRLFIYCCILNECCVKCQLTYVQIHYYKMYLPKITRMFAKANNTFIYNKTRAGY